MNDIRGMPIVDWEYKQWLEMKPSLDKFEECHSQGSPFFLLILSFFSHDVC